MEWNQIERRWMELQERSAEQWGKLTDDELRLTGGNRERLSALLQKKYAIGREHAEMQIAAFERRLGSA